MSKAVIFFAPGLEECEGLLCVDILLTLTLVSFLPRILQEEPHDLH